MKKIVALVLSLVMALSLCTVAFADGYDIEVTKKGVDSAKTFDAGVAMYVGMSLLSVAGGAVVIGKKKEF